MVDAEYDGKRIVDEVDRLDLPGFDRLLGTTLAQIKADVVAGQLSSVPAFSFNRIWVCPGEVRYEEDRDILAIAACPVTLPTEAQYAGWRGTIAASGDTAPLASRGVPG